VEPFDDDKTPIFNPLPTVMLVGLPDDIAEACAKAADPVSTLRVAHAAAAMQRMVSTLPLVILIGASISEKDEDALRQQATAIGALVKSEREVGGPALAEQIFDVLKVAVRDRPLRSM
jgi:alkanesulfonate monooxygenase SsuD/methylene tetrahydromethanopterin reductase-like flavin-dependent oxidoreductase (luciferase family)